MKDFLAALSDDHLVNLSIDLMVQLERGTGTRPVLWLLCRARKRAADFDMATRTRALDDARDSILSQKATHAA